MFSEADAVTVSTCGVFEVVHVFGRLLGSLTRMRRATLVSDTGFVVSEQDVRTVIHITAATERRMKAFGETRTVGLNSESSGHDVTQ